VYWNKNNTKIVGSEPYRVTQAKSILKLLFSREIMQLVEDEIVVLDAQHSIRIIRNSDNSIGMIIDMHYDQEGKLCGGMIPIGDDEWEVRSEDPLTIVPSINCTECLSHGTIVEGEWKDCSATDVVMFFLGMMWPVTTEENLKAYQEGLTLESQALC
jgi:hypothetical protein